MTQRQLAKASRVCKATISCTENGHSQPIELTKQRLARGLKIPLDQLFPVETDRNHLRDYRVKKLMTQTELSKASGVSSVTISFLENQRSVPMEFTKQKLARALKVAPEKLFPPKKQGKIAVPGIQEHRI